MGNIVQILHSLGYNTVQEDYYNKYIYKWNEWYKGNVEDFHSYHVYNGKHNIKCHRYSLGMAKKIGEDWANLLMNEKVAITLEGKAEQEFFDEVCQENNFAVKANEMQEIGAALGTYAFVPRVSGVKVTPSGGLASDSGSKIKIDYVSADKIFPISWENGKITECAFGSTKVIDNDEYYYLQIHVIENGRYVIENHLFRDNEDNLTETDLTSVEGFENIPAKIRTGSSDRQFVIGRLNIANNIDPTIPLGISAYANAIDQLKGCDLTYDSYVNEYILGKKRIMVKLEALNSVDGEPAFDADDIVFYELPEDSQNDTLIREINMEIRSAEHNAGIQDMLNSLSAKCGFGENHYRFNQGSISTATQVISENSTLFRTIKKHEIILEDVLTEFVRIILRLGNTYCGKNLDEDVEVSIDFDDSIIEDKDKDFQRDLIMLNSGILNAYEFRMKWKNEDERTAKESLPTMETLLTGEAAPKAPTEV